MIFFYMLTLCQALGAEPSAIPLPKRIRVESASARKLLWEKLSKPEKKLTYHLLEAGIAGKKLLFFQSHRHALAIKRFLETSLAKQNINTTRRKLGEEGFHELLRYTAKFLDSAGPYSSSNRKYVLKKVDSKALLDLLKRFGSHIRGKQKDEVMRLLYDPSYEATMFPEDPKGTELEKTGGNLYEKGITGAQILEKLDKGLSPHLNCRVLRTPAGLSCPAQTTKTPGIVGDTLRKVVSSLQLARGFAQTDKQRQEIDSMIKYFRKGDIEDFRQANIAWVKDRDNSKIDFMLGWVEVYEDWLARIGSWESYVQIIDPEVSKLAQTLAGHAQYFEDKMPFGEFKKKFAPDYSPPAIMVYYFQEISSYRSGGYNLPNFDDIRRDVGAKNVIRLPLPGETADAEFKEMWQEVLSEFLPSEKVLPVLENRELIYKVIVLLHEIIGHGSGTYDATKYDKNQDPIAGLGALGSALEEQRADLAALVNAADPILVEAGLYKDLDHANKMRELMYDFYLADFLRRLSGQRTFTESHQRGHWLFVKTLLDTGTIGWTGADKKVLIVKNYEKCYKVASDLFAELQRIKATRDVTALEKLFERSAPLDEVEKPWAQDIIKRGENILINAGYVEQPWRVTATGGFTAWGGKTLEEIAPFWEKMN